MLRHNIANLIRSSRVVCPILFMLMVGALLESEAADQTISFGAKTDFGTGFDPFSVAVGDFNGDGKADLAVANQGSVSILLGTGTGSFGAKTDFATGSVRGYSVAVGDFNDDGKLDLAVAHFSTFADNTISILLGTGTGSFAAKTDFGTGRAPNSIAVGDFNGDGELDLAVANAADNTVSILLGTGTGSFGANTDFGTGSQPQSVAVGDFNGDGKLDLAVANSFSTEVSILLGTGTGAFGVKTEFEADLSPRSIAVGDFNGDGKLDLVVANGGAGTVSILLGTGTGSFGRNTDVTTSGFPAVGDFNGDGKLDLAVANGGSDSVSILLGTGTGSFGTKTDFATGHIPQSVAVGDFNGDGQPDLAVANGAAATVSILLNTPFVFTLGFDSPTIAAQAGTKVRVTVNIKRAAGFTGYVTVTPPDPAMGIIPKPPDPITTTATNVAFKLRIKGGAAVGPHPVTFIAHDDAGHSSSATLTVVVQ